MSGNLCSAVVVELAAVLSNRESLMQLQCGPSTVAYLQPPCVECRIQGGGTCEETTPADEGVLSSTRSS